MNSTRLKRIARAIDRLPGQAEMDPEIKAKLEEVRYKVNHNIPMNPISSLEAVSSIPNNLSTFPLVTCNFPNLQKRLIELFPPVK